jgi:hypothetical protein
MQLFNDVIRIFWQDKIEARPHVSARYVNRASVVKILRIAYCKIKSRGRCYAHNFLRFSTIFGEKIGVFLKNQCYDQLFSKFGFVLRKKRPIFSLNFSAKNILKIITLVPGNTSIFKLSDPNNRDALL